MSPWEIPLGVAVGLAVSALLSWLGNATRFRTWPFNPKGGGKA